MSHAKRPVFSSLADGSMAAAQKEAFAISSVNKNEKIAKNGNEARCIISKN
jgi:hypothetical protein